MNRFAQWAKWYMSSLQADILEPPVIDWDKFNAEGLELTKRLKSELGSSANVQYVRAWNDPGSQSGVVDLFLPAKV